MQCYNVVKSVNVCLAQLLSVSTAGTLCWSPPVPRPGHVIYLGRPSYQNVNSLRIDTSSSLKYLDLHLDSSRGGRTERPEIHYLILSKNGFHVNVPSSA